MTATARTRRPGLGLSAQLTVLSLLAFLVCLGGGGYATLIVEQLRRISVEDSRLDQLADDQLSLDELNESISGDVFARYAGLLADGQAGGDLRTLARTALRIQQSDDPTAVALAADEYEFTLSAQQLLTGPPPIRAQVTAFRDRSDQLTDRVDAIRQRLAAQQAARAATREASTRRALERLIAVAVGAASLLFAISWWIRRRLLVALNRVAETARAVAGGDFSARTGWAGDDEVGRLARVLDETGEALQGAFAALDADAARQAFRARLDRALSQVDDEQGLADTVSRALETIAPDRPAELLIADSSEAHLHRFATNRLVAAPGCLVSTPWSCPAVRAGRTAEFASGLELDSCPQLRARPDGDLSARCLPVSFMGRVLGVLHTVGEPGTGPDERSADQLEALAESSGQRLGNLRAFHRVQRQATMDSLTGLPNRRWFEDAVRALASTGAGYGVLIADLDRFKAVNDTYGHAAGDRALRVFADVLRGSLREQDLPCRYGGEEFALVIPGVDAAGVAEVADRLRMALAVAVVGDGPAFTVSYGAADSSMAPDLAGQIALADAALLGAKQQGRDRCLVAGTGATAGINSTAPESTAQNSTAQNSTAGDRAAAGR